MLLVAKNLTGNIFFLYLTYHVPPVLYRYLTDELQKYEWLLSLFFLSLSLQKIFLQCFSVSDPWSMVFFLLLKKNTGVNVKTSQKTSDNWTICLYFNRVLLVSKVLYIPIPTFVKFSTSNKK